MNKNKRIKLFKKAIYFFQKELSLFEWEIHTLEHKDPNNRATIFVNLEGMIISLYFSTTWIEKKDLTDLEIIKVAFHEVYELSLTSIRHSLEDVGIYSHDYIDKIMHTNVRRMENVLFPFLQEKFMKTNRSIK